MQKNFIYNILYNILISKQEILDFGQAGEFYSNVWVPYRHFSNDEF